jgi:hypothetical protein
MVKQPLRPWPEGKAVTKRLPLPCVSSPKPATVCLLCARRTLLPWNGINSQRVQRVQGYRKRSSTLFALT